MTPFLAPVWGNLISIGLSPLSSFLVKVSNWKFLFPGNLLNILLSWFFFLNCLIAKLVYESGMIDFSKDPLLRESVFSFLVALYWLGILWEMAANAPSLLQRRAINISYLIVVNLACTTNRGCLSITSITLHLNNRTHRQNIMLPACLFQNMNK